MDIVSLLYGRQDRDWQSRANCMGVDPDLFFPERGASTREAKEVCRGCVVREDCLEYALANGEKFGIWGGLSERERRRLRRARAMSRRAAATASALDDRASASWAERTPSGGAGARARRASMVRSGSRSSGPAPSGGTASSTAAGARPTSSARPTLGAGLLRPGPPRRRRPAAGPNTKRVDEVARHLGDPARRQARGPARPGLGRHWRRPGPRPRRGVASQRL